MTSSLSILTSWPTSRAAGSGTVTFLEGFLLALLDAGWHATVEVPATPLPATADYHALIAARLACNDLWRDHEFPAGIPLLGLDWDGFRLTEAQRSERQVIASPRGLFADLAATEIELRDSLLQQAEWERTALHAADWAFVASHYAKHKVVELYQVPPERIAVLPNGIHPGFATALAQAEAFSWSRPGILAVAKFYPRKQIPLLIEAYARASAQGLEADLHLLGDGIEMPQVQELVGRHHLENRVHLPGVVTDLVLLARYYRSCLFVCHPSVQETFGNVLVEALAAGKAIVCADAASLPEVAGEVGMYVAAGDVDALADGLLDATRMLLAYPALQMEIAERALVQASRFSWAATVHGFGACLAGWQESRALPAAWV